MKCPVCHVPTYVVEYEKIELDVCGECQGIWFDHGELELLLEPGSDRLRHGAAPSLPDFYNEAIDGLVIGPEVGSCGAAAHHRLRRDRANGVRPRTGPKTARPSC